MSLRGKSLVITGASRGIGLAIGLRAARDGANVAVLAKTTQPHPKLPGTIHTAAAEIEAAGGRALPIACDVRDGDAIEAAMRAAAEAFGGIDILVNNASAISLTSTENTDLKRYDLMQAVDARATFACTRAALPYLRAAGNPHVLTLSPPLDMRAEWFAPHVAYSIAKYGMSLCTLGMAEEFRGAGIAVNSLWPLTAIDTAAVRNLLGGAAVADACRSPEIVADAAHAVVIRDARACTGNFFIDEEVLRSEGVSDFSRYGGGEGPLIADFFVPDAVVERSPTRLARGALGAVT